MGRYFCTGSFCYHTIDFIDIDFNVKYEIGNSRFKARDYELIIWRCKFIFLL